MMAGTKNMEDIFLNKISKGIRVLFIITRVNSLICRSIRGKSLETISIFSSMISI